ncbi:HAD-IIIA family hydrolase [Streptomyces sp. ET3-23]|uniref:D-glycero-alpha-D-manno-heptose-1,7-bisphosphate 7-phosphatase n=1 Tax=Streptomyces sp. ET3-23 TaxID=2885643 RepID=UPI001D0F657B|nr:HAD-IIIA family hydrolase [Streptomyces sp. ET3-23]MCC2274456.1 HAD-IIIA family hydrolase [Streptomyces sp. ET3-23]
MSGRALPAVVLFDRDGTLVEDVPYNGDPARVVPLPGVRRSLALLRRLRVRTGVVTNQSGIGRGLLTPAQVWSVNARVEELLGPFDVWAVCPHDPAEGCACRKPAPGLVLEAARLLDVAPADCVLIGDIGSDMEAAAAAGAAGVLVPTPITRTEEVDRVPRSAHDLPTAVRTVLDGGRGVGNGQGEADDLPDAGCTVHDEEPGTRDGGPR